MKKYQYSSLQHPTSIRLLILERDAGAADIRFSLEEVDLQDEHGYEALSYTWKEPAFYNGKIYIWKDDTLESLSINIGGNGIVEITKNLHELLEHLAGTIPAGETSCKVWADQVCINQQDLAERSQQVSIMQDIYKSACRTLIWLGKPDEHTPDFLELLRGFITPPFDFGAKITAPLFHELQKRLKDLLSSIDSRSDQRRQKDYISSLIGTINRPWFSRAWVVQEAALSVNPVVIHGSETFDLRILDHLLVAAAKVETDGKQLQQSQILRSRGAKTLRHIQSCRQRILSNKDTRGQLSFLDILQRLAFSLDATDGRDHVYAFLAFQDPELPQLKADYSFDIIDAYVMISASLAYNTDSLALLGLVRGALYPSSLPSWAIDWRLNKSIQGARFDNEGRSKFNASCGRLYKPGVGPVPGQKSLWVRGKVIDQIQFVSAVGRESEDVIPGQVRLYEELEYITGNWTLAGQAFNQTEPTELLKRLLAVLTAFDYGPSITDDDKDTELNNRLFVYQNFGGIITRDDNSDNKKELNRIRRELSRGAHICRRKRLFVGTEYDSLGLGPQTAREKDLICILHGSRVPCVLRQDGFAYRVIGQCYYEKWMYGNLVDWKEDQANIFELM